MLVQSKKSEYSNQPEGSYNGPANTRIFYLSSPQTISVFACVHLYIPWHLQKISAIIMAVYCSNTNERQQACFKTESKSVWTFLVSM